MARKTIRNPGDLIAYLAEKAAKEGPDSMAAIMLANAKAKQADPTHTWKRDILKAAR
jgi:hypothetical protein